MSDKNTKRAKTLTLVDGTPKGSNENEKPSDLITPEMVIGICCPIGSPAHEIANLIKTQLEREYAYEAEIIKLSDIIRKVMNDYHLEVPVGVQNANTKKTYWIKDHIDSFAKDLVGHSDEYIKKKSLIEAGNRIRTDFKSLSPLASFAIKEINHARVNEAYQVIDSEYSDPEKREKVKDDLKDALSGKKELSRKQETLVRKANVLPRRRCFIIDSLKNKEELNLLRDTYGKSFFLLGVSSTLDIRKMNLTTNGTGGMTPAEFELLVKQDTGEEIEEGQSVSDIFCEADYFMRVTNNESQRAEKTARMLKVVFNSHLITPNPHENAMYQAASAAGNSACMFRQVGAAISDKTGEIISVGWNDVPKYGGNLYREENQAAGIEDNRCYNWGTLDCHNDLQKDINSEVIASSISKSIIHLESLAINDEDKESVKQDIIKAIAPEIRAHPKFKNLIEFSRSIHAEMHAILSAPRDKMINSSLYCTTYPCHSCARHIVAAGIKEVFFIEPYSKSLATRLHEDSISEDNKENKVNISVFEGVAPRRYMDLFKLPNSAERKHEGKYKKTDNREAIPSICRTTLASVSALENLVINSLSNLEARLKENNSIH